MKQSTFNNRLGSAAIVAMVTGMTACTAPPVQLEHAQIALLRADGNATIQLMDLQTGTTETIDPGIGFGDSISTEPDGSFLITNTADGITRVLRDGRTEPFTTHNPWAYRLHVAPDGNAFAAQEYDATEWDGEGERIHTAVYDTNYCWMDATASRDGDGVALLDIFGPSIAEWNTATNELDIVASNLPVYADILGRDGSGRFYAGAGNELAIVRDNGTIGRVVLPFMGAMMAIEEASDDSVYVLVSDGGSRGFGGREADAPPPMEDGPTPTPDEPTTSTERETERSYQSAVYLVDVRGEIQEIVAPVNALWIDMSRVL